MITPIRIQMRRIRGFRLQEESKRINGLSAVLVTRPTKWGNIYKVGELSKDFKYPVTQEQAIAFHKNFIEKSIQDNNENLVVIQKELGGKNLACWCKLTENCHSKILLSLANNIPLDQVK